MKRPLELDQRWEGMSIPESSWHFHRQLLGRYGVVLDPGEYSQMIRDIKSGRAPVVEQRTRRTAIHMTRLHKQFEWILVLSDGKQLLTAWPPERRLMEKGKTFGQE